MQELATFVTPGRVVRVLVVAVGGQFAVRWWAPANGVYKTELKGNRAAAMKRALRAVGGV